MKNKLLNYLLHLPITKFRLLFFVSSFAVLLLPFAAIARTLSSLLLKFSILAVFSWINGILFLSLLLKNNADLSSAKLKKMIYSFFLVFLLLLFFIGPVVGFIIAKKYLY